MNQSSANNNLPHKPFVIVCLRILFVILLILFFLIPTVLKAFPGVLVFVAFLNHVRWPLFVNLSDPVALQLNGTTSFVVETNYQSTLGAWHILPEIDGSVVSAGNVNSIKSADKVLLYLHGNAGTRAGWHRIQLYKVLSKIGLHIVTFDYRGYGDSDGYPSEDGLVEDSMYMFKYIRKLTNAPIFIWGHSLGTGVAIKAAMHLKAQGIKFEGLILESPFTNFIDASNNHPFSLPIRSMPWYSWAFTEGLKKVGIRFESDKSIAKVEADTLILHAEDDGIVPYALGRKLYEVALKTKKTGSVELVTFEGKFGYGHKHIHKAPELPSIIVNFMKKRTQKM